MKITNLQIKEKNLQKLIQKRQQKTDKVAEFQYQSKKNNIQEKEGLNQRLLCSTLPTEKIMGICDRVWQVCPVWQKENSIFKAQEMVERRNTPPLWHAAFPSILNHLLLNQCQSSHWPPWRLDWTHRGINPTGSKTNEGHGFLHELVTNRIKPVKQNQIKI